MHVGVDRFVSTIHATTLHSTIDARAAVSLVSMQATLDSR